MVYRILLAQSDPERTLFLAVSDQVYDSLLSESLGRIVVAKVPLPLLVFDGQQKKVVRWIS